MFKTIMLTVALMLFSVTAFGANQFIVGAPTTSNDTMFVPVKIETDQDSLKAFELVCSYPPELTLLGANWDQSVVRDWPLRLAGTNPQFADNYTAIVAALWSNGSNDAPYVNAGTHKAFTLIFRVNSYIESPTFAYTVLKDCPPGANHIPMFIYKTAQGLYSEWVNVITETATDVTDQVKTLPTAFRLYNNYPNPFNPSTVIKFDLPTRAYVQIDVINILGQTVETLCAEDKSAGSHSVTWNASQYSSGITFISLLQTNIVKPAR